MAGPPTPAYMQATLVFGGAALPEGAVTTFGMLWLTDETARDDVAQLFGLVHRDNFSTQTTLERVEFKRGPSETGPTFVHPVGLAGLVAGDSAGPNTALLVHKRVSLVSARLHGRSFWPGLGESQVNGNGDISGPSLPFLQDAFDDLWTALEAAGAQPHVFSASSSDARAVSSFEVDGRTATQRRRLRR